MVEYRYGISVTKAAIVSGCSLLGWICLQPNGERCFEFHFASLPLEIISIISPINLNKSNHMSAMLTIFSTQLKTETEFALVDISGDTY